jgi:soluble lytic murein transglycosylase-like protein/tetratricopeptide (TPR) repeat protein
MLAFLALCPHFAVASPSVPEHDAAFREGWSLLQKERYAEARAVFATIPPLGYDLGDYVVYFGAEAAAREGRRTEAEEALRLLEETFPGSPLLPYLRHDVAYVAALDNDVAASRQAFGLSRGKVSGSRRRAEEGYVAAFLAEEGVPSAEAAALHLENFSTYTAREAGILSFERLWKWRADGLLAGWDLSPGFYAKFAKAAARAGEAERARALFEEAISRIEASAEYFAMVLDYAEFHRKQGETAAAAALLEKHLADAPPAFRSEARFLRARVEWKAGRLAEARKEFLDIAEGDALPGTADRAWYLAAWIAEDEGDLAGATESYERLRGARDDSIRQEARFRFAYGLYRMGRRDEAIAAFDVGETGGGGTVERARHRYWKARALRDAGREAEAAPIFSDLAGDAFAGIYAIFAVSDRRAGMLRFLDASSDGETKACGEEREQLWARIRKANWGPADAEKVRRAERLTLLGVIDYAVLEASLVDRTAARKAIGMGDGGAPGLIRYLAGDLKGGIYETSNVPLDPMNPGLVDRIQYPLAPEFLADCDRRRSGIDPLVLLAVIRQESRFQADVLSSAGAVGLMQLMPRTAAETARKEKMAKPGRKELLRPSVNIRLGAAYLSRLVKGYGGDYFRAIAAYNAGEAAVKRWWTQANGDPAAFLEGINYKETRFYLRRVFLNLLQYHRIYRPETFARYFPKPPAGAKIEADAEPIPPPGAPADNVLSPPPTPEAAPTEPPPPPPPAGM